jgi:hypothetical protein
MRMKMAALGAVLAVAPVQAADAPHLEFAFEEIVALAAAIVPGKTPYGGRNMIPITGGTFEGPGIKGIIVPGGWDWQLIRADGCIDVKADYMLKTDDGVVINVVNTGALCLKDGKLGSVRTQPRFEAPLGKYAWLNQAAFIGTLEPTTIEGKPAVKIRFYKAV